MTHNIRRGDKERPKKDRGYIANHSSLKHQGTPIFHWDINFLRRFIPNLAELCRNITNMLKNEQGVKWTLEAKKSFELIKQALTKTPILISLDFSKYFYIFSFASKHIIVVVLLQKNP